MKKEENIAVEAMKRGFTLVELLVVVAILGILGTIAVQNVGAHIDETSITAARAGVDSLGQACATYKLKHKKWPKSLDDLCEGGDEAILQSDKYLYDPWDNKYEMETKGKGIVIKSAGKDGIMGNEDDIRSDDKKKKNG